MNRLSRAFLLFGVLLAIVLASCGGSTSSSSADDDLSAVSSAETSTAVLSAETPNFHSDDDVLVWMSGCIAEVGIPNTIDHQFGSLGLGPTEGTAEGFVPDVDRAKEVTLLFRQAVDTCAERAEDEGVKRPANYLKTEADWLAEYDHRLQTRKCLLDAGYKVQDPPSLEAYIDAQGDWSPHPLSTAAAGPIEDQTTFRQCHQ